MESNDFITAPQCPGIYYFKNKINGKYYVGQALKLRRRLQQHARRFNSGNYKNVIYLAINKYGWENFEWRIIETFKNISKDKLQNKLDEEEIKYIKEFDSYNNGYNQTTGGRGVKDYNYTKVAKKKISDVSKKVSHDGRNKVYYYDIIEKKYGEELTLKDFLMKHNIVTRHLDILVMKKLYIVARTKEELQNKIERYYNYKSTKSTTRKCYNKNTKNNLPIDIVNDILNGISDKDFCTKYHLCRKTYFTYKKIIYDEVGNRPKRIYKTKVDLNEYKEYRATHTLKDSAEHFHINVATASEYDKKLKK